MALQTREFAIVFWRFFRLAPEASVLSFDLKQGRAWKHRDDSAVCHQLLDDGQVGISFFGCDLAHDSAIRTILV